MPRAVGDVNGDGKADVVGFGNEGVYVSLSTGSAFSQPAIWLANNYNPAKNWTTNAKYPRFVADVNGDKRGDVVGVAEDGVYVSLSNGSAFAAYVKWSDSFCPEATWSETATFPRAVADVNGDGKADFVGFATDGVYVALSTGTAFSEQTKWITQFGTDAEAGGWVSSDSNPRTVADVNGDGKADAVGFANAGVFVALSTGAAFSNGSEWVHSFAPQAGCWTSASLFPRSAADFNGDGKGDVIGFGDAGVYGSRSTGSAFSAPPADQTDPGTSTGSNEQGFCWKANYMRGVTGGLPNTCSSTQEKQAGLCYDKCPANQHGDITPVGGWAAPGKATVEDAAKRTFKLNFGSGPATLTLSEFGETMTGGSTIANRLNWDKRCKNGLEYFVGLCYDVPVGYEVTTPGFIGLPCPLG